MSFLKKSYRTIACALITQLLGTFSISPILGTNFLSFNLTHALTPLTGFFGNGIHIVVAYMVHTAITGLYGSIGFNLFNHMPTFCGALFLATDSRFLKASISTLCIVMFLLHPIGRECAFYTLYWIPPLIISFLPRSPLFIQALGSTLTTHAVGSILWIYSHNTTVAFWQTLMCCVWIERLLFALVLAGSSYALHISIPFLKKIVSSKQLRSKLCPTGS
ncbi:hypothetical protein H0X06_01015 [Candidatus Dependentiae bacterium]|nr:hypothetical protein [Candidatus Dependentiae bacterium]